MKVELEILNKCMYDMLEKLIQGQKLEQKKIVLFGLNSTSFAARQYLAERGYRVHAYIDNDKKKVEETEDFLRYQLCQHLSVQEIMLIHTYIPEELLEQYDEDVVVLVGSKYYSQMLRQLERMGYNEGKQVYQIVDFYDIESYVKEAPRTAGRELTALEIKEYQLNLLKFLDNTCEQNGLRYYICGGTLLGAVRHKGYIPWDDDIDVVMPLSDYKRLIELMKKSTKYSTISQYDQSGKYYNFFMRLTDNSTVMKVWEYPFLMTCGVNIDIFPLFGLPEGGEEALYFYHKIRRLNQRYIGNYITGNLKGERLEQIQYSLQEQIITMMESYDFDKSSQIGYLLSKYKEKEIMPRKLYENSVELEFEGQGFQAAVGYNDYLSRLFGNYMELPPEKARLNTHSNKAYVRNGVV